MTPPSETSTRRPADGQAVRVTVADGGAGGAETDGGTGLLGLTDR